VLIFFIAGLLYLLRFERVDNLGAYRIPPETGILIPSGFVIYGKAGKAGVRADVDFGRCAWAGAVGSAVTGSRAKADSTSLRAGPRDTGEEVASGEVQYE
jgi:hypothetical protein